MEDELEDEGVARRRRAVGPAEGVGDVLVHEEEAARPRLHVRVARAPLAPLPPRAEPRRAAPGVVPELVEVDQGAQEAGRPRAPVRVVAVGVGPRGRRQLRGVRVVVEAVAVAGQHGVGDAGRHAEGGVRRRQLVAHAREDAAGRVRGRDQREQAPLELRDGRRRRRLGRRRAELQEPLGPQAVLAVLVGRAVPDGAGLPEVRVRRRVGVDAGPVEQPQ